MHAGPRGTGTALERFRLNALVTELAFGGLRGRVYRRVVALSETAPGDRVLDVGSSSGYLARMLAAAAGPSGSVTGVDPSEPAIAYARRHAAANTSFRGGVAQDLSAFADGSFDVVTSTLAIHHVPARGRQAAFAEMYRVTRPGGRLLVADFDPSRRVLALHPGAARMQRAAAATGPLEELAANAGYRVTASGVLPLLRYVAAVRDEPGPDRDPAALHSAPAEP
ncbi:MAG TPA: class I SAM-dependent methyltransferase [Trebonia sp.]|jgi:ubiquinone/menaquinone biosynthesis C-methylase UbiE